MEESGEVKELKEEKDINMGCEGKGVLGYWHSKALYSALGLELNLVGKLENVLKMGVTQLVFKDSSGHSFGEWICDQDVTPESLGLGDVQADEYK